jgi:hypothetical protein
MVSDPDGKFLLPWNIAGYRWGLAASGIASQYQVLGVSDLVDKTDAWHGDTSHRFPWVRLPQLCRRFSTIVSKIAGLNRLLLCHPRSLIS